MTPIVRRFNNGLLIEFSGATNKAMPDVVYPPVVVSLEWDEAAVLETALRHELEDRDREDGLAPDAPADSRHEAGEPK